MSTMLSHAIPESLGLSAGARDARPNTASARPFPQAYAASHLGGRLLLQRCGGGTCAPGSCNHDEELRLARAPSAPATEGLAPPIVYEVLRSSGQPLEPSTLTMMNQHLRHDFSPVRVHTGSRAEASVRSVNALAYTVGRHVVLGSGQYHPDTSVGRRLLAHELVHVTQQGGGDPLSAPDLTVEAVDSPLEREASTATGPVAPWASRDRLFVARDTPGGSGTRSAAARVSGSATVFTPGDNHGHMPSGHWADVQAAPNSGFAEGLICSHLSPTGVVGAAIADQFSDKPIALRHLFWYLGAGGGADLVEDANLESMLRTDSGVQGLLNARIPTGRTSGTVSGHFKIDQADYVNQDFRFAFGAIDRLDFEADLAAGTLHAWFQDRYEWHPVYRFYTAMAGDAVRSTNCVHAALVELKSGGLAKDYWMKGEATVPLSVIRPAPGTRGGGRTL